MDENYPPISKLQLERNHEPEYGVQTAVLSIKVTKQRHYYNDDLYKGRTDIKIQHADLVSDNEAHIHEDDQGICTVSESLLPLSIAHTVPRHQELEKLSGAIQLELNYDNDMHKELVFQYPTGKKLRDVAMATTDEKSLLRVLLNTAKLIAEFHNADWIMRSICALDMWVAEENTRVFPLRLSRCCELPPSEDWIIDDVFRDRQNWLPIETLRDEEYTKEGDVYQFAMTVVEVFNVLDLSGPEKHLLSSIPFASINKKTDLENALLRGELPQRPSKCPDRLFAVLERCMSRERISRPKIQDVLSCIMNCIRSNTETAVAVIKRQRMSTSNVNRGSEYYVNANNTTVYKDPVATKQCDDQCGSKGTNDRNVILRNYQSEYTNVSASKEMYDKEHNKIPIKEDANILSKNENVSVHDAGDMCTNPVADSSIVESNEYSYSFEHKDTLERSIIINSSHQARIPVPDDCDTTQRRAPLSKQKRDSEVHTDIEVMNMSEPQDYTIQNVSKRTHLLDGSNSSNVPASEGVYDVSEEHEISMNEKRIQESKTQNVSVKETYQMYPSGVENEAYSYAKKENLPNSNIVNFSNQARISVPEQFDPMLQRRATLPGQKADRERHIEVDLGRHTFYQDKNKLKNLPHQINTISKKASRLTKLSKLKSKFTRRFWPSKSHSATPYKDTEHRDGAGSASSSNGTMNSSSGGSLMFCNDSTSGTSVEIEAEDEAVYDEIPEYEHVSLQSSLSCGNTYEKDASNGEEQDIFPFKEHQDSPRIKETCSTSTTSIVIENDSLLQSVSTDIHTASLDEASYRDITFENEEIYECSSVGLDSIILEEGDAIKTLDDRKN